MNDLGRRLAQNKIFFLWLYHTSLLKGVSEHNLPVSKLPFRAPKNVLFLRSLVGLIPRMQLGMRLSTSIKALSISVGNAETVILASKQTFTDTLLWYPHSQALLKVTTAWLVVWEWGYINSTYPGSIPELLPGTSEGQWWGGTWGGGPWMQPTGGCEHLDVRDLSFLPSHQRSTQGWSQGDGGQLKSAANTNGKWGEKVRLRTTSSYLYR